jgi:protein subunit release factor B
MDWAGMLYRMYMRYAEKKGYKVTLMDYQEGEEAGMKSCSVLIEGLDGLWLSESGEWRAPAWCAFHRLMPMQEDILLLLR